MLNVEVKYSNCSVFTSTFLNNEKGLLTYINSPLTVGFLKGDFRSMQTDSFSFQALTMIIKTSTDYNTGYGSEMCFRACPNVVGVTGYLRSTATVRKGGLGAYAIQIDRG